MPRRLRVSIVIPTYNEQRHLGPCLEAIAAQTLRPFEVIVVDNGSTDRTATVARSFPFVKVVSEPRQGRVFARGRGFDAVTGDIIGRIDADTMLPANWVEHVTRFYTDPNHADQAWSGAGYFYNVPLPGLVSFAYGLLAFRFNKLLLGHFTLWGSNMALTAAQWQAVRTKVCARTDIHEDLDLAIHLATAGYGITYDMACKTPAELRRVHEDRHQLWDYLQWWPRTLRIHGRASWVFCWLVGAFGLYVATLILLLADKLKMPFKTSGKQTARHLPIKLDPAD
jgi:glycosyltransferase involved in cell wall biosynthesis